MSSLDKARETQLTNIQSKSGKSIDEIRALIAASGLDRHGEIRSMLMDKLSLGYGDANMLVHFALESDGQSAAEAAGASGDAVLDEIYAGAKSALRPIHDALLAIAAGFGPFEIVPKKGYVSLRRQKQFAMVGPGTRGRLELGLNMKGVDATPRLTVVPPGGMCQYKVFLTSLEEADQEVAAWLRTAYDAAG